MREEPWRFRTERGIVTVREDELGIRETPRYFLSGQRSRWRYGDRWERAKMAFRTGGFVTSLLGLLIHLSTVAQTGPNVQTPPYVVFFVLFSLLVFSNHLREQSIPRSAIEDLVLDDSTEELTIFRNDTGGLLDDLRIDPERTTLSLPTEGDVREAKEIFRLRGFDLTPPEAFDRETETTYRVTVRDGACFCGRCARQVSPSDGSCPSCGYQLRVRVPIDDAASDDERSVVDVGSADGTVESPATETDESELETA